jgi:hypothetical protein
VKDGGGVSGRRFESFGHEEDVFREADARTEGEESWRISDDVEL